MAIYISISPFVGFHTIMKCIVSWIFGINFALLFIISTLINNPWTMLPIYGIDYWLGTWLFSFTSIDHYAYNPRWIIVCNEWLQHYIGYDNFSLWAFLVGGNVLAALVAGISYPLLKWLITMVKNEMVINESKERILRTVHSSRKAIHLLQKKAVPIIQQVTRKARVQKVMPEEG
jgi:uncharacterized protein (DUF2062 family)